MHWHICEDNLPSFLTAVFYAYYNGQKADGISADKRDVMLGDTMSEFAVDYTLARRVRNGINKYDREAYNDIEYVFASEIQGRFKIIFDYIRFLFKVKCRIDDMFAAQKEVRSFADIKYKVWHEIHRLHGFMRFQELKNGVMYAHYASDHDVLAFVVPHFAERFNTERLIIHDLKRGNVALCENGAYRFTRLEGTAELELSEDEEFYLGLWKQYHKNVTIESRRNQKLQAGFMPRRYRWFMYENE